MSTSKKIGLLIGLLVALAAAVFERACCDHDTKAPSGLMLSVDLLPLPSRLALPDGGPP